MVRQKTIASCCKFFTLFTGLVMGSILSSIAQKTLNTTINDTIQIQEVSVSARTNKKLSGSLSGRIVLNPESVATLPAMLGNTDLLKLLELTPGVQNAGDANTDLYIRGGDPGQNLLLYNETPIYSPGHLLGFFPLFNNDHLSSLELDKSGVNSSHGGRLSAVIKVKSKKERPEKAGLKGNVGLISSQLTATTPIGKKMAAYLSLRKTYLSLLMKPALNTTINNRATNKIEDPNYDFQDANFTLAGQINSRHSFQLDAFIGGDQLKMTEEEILLNGSINWKNQAASLSWKIEADNDISFNQHFFFSHFNNKSDFRQGEIDMYLSSAIKDWGYKNILRFSFFSLPMETGMQYTFHDISPQTVSTDYSGTYFPQQINDIYRAHDAAAYLQTTFLISERLTAEAGLRYSLFHSDRKTFQRIDPRLSLRYRLKENVFLRAAAGRQSQSLRLLSQSSVGIPLDFWVCASREIPIQSGNDFSFGYYRNFSEDAYELSGDIYFRTLSQLSEYRNGQITANTSSLEESILYGEGKAYGVELMLKKNTGKLNGWISYSLGRSERQFEGINRGKTFPARFDRRHDLSIVASYTINEKWDVSATCVYASGHAYTLPSSWYFINNTPVKQYGEYNGARMPDYKRTDLSIHYWFRKNNGINFSVYNLFMEKNPVYVFLNIKEDPEKGEILMKVKKKRLATIVPSVSWKFNF